MRPLHGLAVFTLGFVLGLAFLTLVYLFAEAVS